MTAWRWPQFVLAGGMLEHRDAAIDHPLMRDILKRTGATHGVSVERRQSPMALAEKCYWNVEEYASTRGGMLLFGWMLVEVTGIMLIAWHHGVWRSSSGILLDISPPPVPGLSNRTTFLVDVAQDHSIAWPPAFPQIILPILKDAAVDHFIQIKAELDQLCAQFLFAQRSVPGVRYDWRQSVISYQNEPAKAHEMMLALSGRFQPAISRKQQELSAILPFLAAKQRATSQSFQR